MITLGVLALRIGIRIDQLDRLCRRDEVPYERIGRLRVFQEKDIDAIRAAAIRAGYLKPTEPHS